jgi:type I restriction enzyme S subunit
MISGLKPYLQMKDSGVPWLGEVPEHWEVRKVREVGRVINGFPFDAGRFSQSTGYPLIRIRDLDRARTATRYDGPFIESARVNPGDVLIGMDGDFNVGTWRGAEPALLNQRMCCIRSAEPVTERLLAYLLPGPLKQINDVTWSTTVKHLASSQVERIQLGLPPLPEQTAIVRFLDHADRRIRRYIRAKQKLIKLLEEQKQAIIHRAVTRGLDPNVRLKPSGVEWLGEVPEHWEVRKLRQCGSISGGMTPSMADRSLWDGDVPWVTPKDMKRATIAAASMNVSRKALEVTSLRLIPSGSVLLVVRGMILARRVPIARTVQPVTINQDMKAIVPAAGIDAGYLAYRMDATQATFASMIDEAGHGTKRFPTERWKNIVLAVPPVNEQRQIVSYLDQATAQLAGAVDVAQREIELLREYRTRLIADVVTGKLDVREAAARLPQEAEEPGQLDELSADAEGDEAAADATDATPDEIDA